MAARTADTREEEEEEETDTTITTITAAAAEEEETEGSEGGGGGGGALVGERNAGRRPGCGRERKTKTRGTRRRATTTQGNVSESCTNYCEVG